MGRGSGLRTREISIEAIGTLMIDVLICVQRAGADPFVRCTHD